MSFMSSDIDNSLGVRFVEATKRRTTAELRRGSEVAAVGGREAAIARPADALAACLLARRSFRNFARSSLVRSDISGLLGELSTSLGAGEPADYSGLFRSGGKLRYVDAALLVNRVPGLEAGLYAIDFERCDISLAQAFDVGAFLARNTIQVETPGCPAALVSIGLLRQSLLDHGNRGYRYMLFEAGMLIQRMFLGLSAQGLGGVPNGSIMHRNFDRMLGVDGMERTCLNVFPFGRPMDEPGAGTD